MSTTIFKRSRFFRFVARMVLAAFAGLLPVRPSFAQVAMIMPPVGQMVHITSHFEPPQMVGLKINLKDPFSFDFIMDQGQTSMSEMDRKDEFNKIIKYFLVSLAMPNKDMWVNLSPYENNRIIPAIFGQTEMGRDLLAQDYVLKQFTASLMYPEDSLGKKFWERVYAQAQARFGTTDIKVSTFNKVWIVADKADVYQKDDTAFLVDSHLKVMLEQDYLAMAKHRGQPGDILKGTVPYKTVMEGQSPLKCPQARCEHLRVSGMRTQASEALNVEAPQGNNGSTSENVNALGAQVVREIIIPAIEKEVNEGKSFAAVRQVYSAEIMATWFKKTLRQSLLGQVFADSSKISGQMLRDPQVMERIYQQYLRAYRKGVFNYIKEDATPDGQMIPRKYFSGGLQGVTDAAMHIINPAMLRSSPVLKAKVTDSAMWAVKNKRWVVASVALISATAAIAFTTPALAATPHATMTQVVSHTAGQYTIQFQDQKGTSVTAKAVRETIRINGHSHDGWQTANGKLVYNGHVVINGHPEGEGWHPQKGTVAAAPAGRHAEAPPEFKLGQIPPFSIIKFIAEGIGHTVGGIMAPSAAPPRPPADIHVPAQRPQHVTSPKTTAPPAGSAGVRSVEGPSPQQEQTPKAYEPKGSGTDSTEIVPVRPGPEASQSVAPESPPGELATEPQEAPPLRHAMNEGLNQATASYNFYLGNNILGRVLLAMQDASYKLFFTYETDKARFKIGNYSLIDDITESIFNLPVTGEPAPIQDNTEEIAKKDDGFMAQLKEDMARAQANADSDHAKYIAEVNKELKEAADAVSAANDRVKTAIQNQNAALQASKDATAAVQATITAVDALKTDLNKTEADVLDYLHSTIGIGSGLKAKSDFKGTQVLSETASAAALNLALTQAKDNPEIARALLVLTTGIISLNNIATGAGHDGANPAFIKQVESVKAEAQASAQAKSQGGNPGITQIISAYNKGAKLSEIIQSIAQAEKTETDPMARTLLTLAKDSVKAYIAGQAALDQKADESAKAAFQAGQKVADDILSLASAVTKPTQDRVIEAKRELDNANAKLKNANAKFNNTNDEFKRTGGIVTAPVVSTTPPEAPSPAAPPVPKVIPEAAVPSTPSPAPSSPAGPTVIEQLKQAEASSQIEAQHANKAAESLNEYAKRAEINASNANSINLFKLLSVDQKGIQTDITYILINSPSVSTPALKAVQTYALAQKVALSNPEVRRYVIAIHSNVITALQDMTNVTNNIALAAAAASKTATDWFNTLGRRAVTEEERDQAKQLATETATVAKHAGELLDSFKKGENIEAIIQKAITLDKDIKSAANEAAKPAKTVKPDNQVNGRGNSGRRSTADQAMSHSKTQDHLGGINLSDEYLAINIKVDGAGMPLPAQYQDAAMLNLKGLTSIIRKITPMSPQAVPALYELLKS